MFSAGLKIGCQKENLCLGHKNIAKVKSKLSNIENDEVLSGMFSALTTIKMKLLVFQYRSSIVTLFSSIGP
jgi:hypothetical protein